METVWHHRPEVRFDTADAPGVEPCQCVMTLGRGLMHDTLGFSFFQVLKAF